MTDISSYQTTYDGTSQKMLLGDCRELMEAFPDNYFDNVQTDPPYENQAFNRVFGVNWDTNSGVTTPKTWAEVKRILKPGAWAVVFSGSRTSWKMAAAMAAGGLEIFESIAWIYASGQGKGMKLPGGRAIFMRPAHEIIWLARKPIDNTYRNNIERWGLGGINLDESRFNTVEQCFGEPTDFDDCAYGRYPMNTVFTHAPTCQFLGVERVSGVRVPTKDSGNPGIFRQGAKPGKLILEKTGDQFIPIWRCDEEFCPVAQLTPKMQRKYAQFGHSPADEVMRGFRAEGKPDWYERLAGIGNGVTEPPHITLKPVELFRWLIRLTCPPGGRVLDPYVGGATAVIAAALEGRSGVGIERSSASNTGGKHPYFEYACNRLDLLQNYGEHWRSSKRALLDDYYTEQEEKEDGE